MTLRDMLPGLLVVLALVGCGGEPPPGETPGFAGLGEASEGFMPASPGMTLRFPEDHGPHPATRIEWWYLTANLKDATGEPLGLQWTLFRQALAPPPEAPPEERPAPAPWVTDQLWMAHMAVSRGATHRVAERFARSHSRQGDGQAGVRAQPFAAWLDGWRLESRVDDPDADTFERLTLVAHQDDAHGGFGYRLELTAEGPLVLHGEAGFSQKTADGQGSMYYSQPFWRIEGEVTLDGETRAVSGRGWLDREWSSQLLEPEQSGWDWVALHLDSGHKLMTYRLRGGGEAGGDFLFGNVIAPDGAATPVAQGGLRLTPLSTSLVAGRELPTRWRLELPAQGLDLVVEARHSERWMATSVPYWEGEVTVSDHDSDEALGEGYLEMTGY